MTQLVERFLVTTEGRIIWPKEPLPLTVVGDLVFINDLGYDIVLAAIVWVWSDGRVENHWCDYHTLIMPNDSLTVRVVTPKA